MQALHEGLGFRESCLTWTCRTRICMGRHCTLRLLQQPEHRCTSTQGGHTTKLALVLSTMSREISKTTVRVLHSARTAGSAAARASVEAERRREDERGCATVINLLQPSVGRGTEPIWLCHTHVLFPFAHLPTSLLETVPPHVL